MPPSAEEIDRLWKLYDEAENYIAEISSLWVGLDTTAINQLRYAGRHLLNALSGKTSITPEEEFRRAEAHAKRALFDALDSGIIYCLRRVEIFKDDYRKIEITCPGYDRIIASAREAKHLLDKARTEFDSRHEYYEEARTHYRKLKEICDTLDDARPEQNKRLRNHNLLLFLSWATLFFTVASVVLGAMALR